MADSKEPRACADIERLHLDIRLRHADIDPAPFQNSSMADHVGTRSLDDIIAESPLLSFHRKICEIESLSNHEETVGKFLIGYLEKHGFKVETQLVRLDDEGDDGDTKSKRFNLYAYPSSSPRPEIFLSSHIDTVPPHIPYSLSLPSKSDSTPSKRRDIRIAGRGTVDAKGSLACQVTATLDYLKSHPSAPLGLLFVVSEETGGAGMRHFSKSALNTSPPSYHTVIFGEPTENKLVAGHKGIVHFDIHAKGKAAHSGYPWLGCSAVSEILPVLTRLDALGDIPVSDGGLPPSEKYGRTTVNIGLMQGGIAGNVVPAAASARVMVRLAAGTVPQAREIIKEAVRDASWGNKDVTVEFTGSEGYSPVDLDTDVEGFDVITVNYGTDVPNLKLHNQDDPKYRVKRYLYGPGTIFVAHGDDEALTVGDLEDAVDGYTRLIKAAVQRGKGLNASK